MNNAEALKADILRLTREYNDLVHAAQLPGHKRQTQFIPGETTVPYAGRVFDADEVEAAVGSTLDFWLTLGKEGDKFEAELAKFLGVRRSILCNSGSSANLLAVAALTSHKLGDRRLKRLDEVITVAAGFPTTVAPIVQNGLVPVFIDSDPVTLNARVGQLEAAFDPAKTKAVMMAHTLGNPFDLTAVTEFCQRHNLWLIEDNCDALGCTYSMPVAKAKALGLDHLLKLAESNSSLATCHSSLPAIRDGLLVAYTGTFGDLSTQSFYPPHHITLGEGGAVNVVHNMLLKTLVESFRDWGRDCWCASGVDNTCGKRFGWQLGELPKGYDHKYTYSHFGYNLKPLDIQAAIGVQQLRKLPDFVRARIDNWDCLRRGLANLEEFFEFMLPTHATGWTPQGFEWSHESQPPSHSSHVTCHTGCSCSPSWFGFMLRVRPTAPFTKFEFVRHLDEKKIGNRMLFGGNLVRQPMLVQMRQDYPESFRVVSDLAGADAIMHGALFIGTYPGLTRPMIDYVIETIHAYCRAKAAARTSAR